MNNSWSLRQTSVSNGQSLSHSEKTRTWATNPTSFSSHLRSEEEDPIQLNSALEASDLIQLQSETEEEDLIRLTDDLSKVDLSGIKKLPFTNKQPSKSNLARIGNRFRKNHRPPQNNRPSTDNRAGKINSTWNSTHPQTSNEPRNATHPQTSNEPRNATQAWSSRGLPRHVDERRALSEHRTKNRFPACQGLTIDNKPCERDGKNDIPIEGRTEHYCYQHDPQNRSKQCHGINKGNKKQCEKICSYPSELRNGGRPVCNQHFRLGVELIRSA
ncbi:hypothetical protein BGZ46_003077 [Entomortierella lignicola]|nr:hypothetical protein BGZ46_003077 [Entomortierella lignicola]